MSTDEDPSLRVESSAIINLRGVSTKLNKYNPEQVVRFLLCINLTWKMEQPDCKAIYGFLQAPSTTP